MQSHSLIQVGRDLRRPPHPSTSSKQHWLLLYTRLITASSSQGLNTLREGGYTTNGQSLPVSDHLHGQDIFPLSPVSISPHATCAQFFSLPHFWAPLRRVWLCTHSAPLRKQSLHQDPTQSSHLWDEQTQLFSLSSCAMTSLMALLGSFPLDSLFLVLESTAWHKHSTKRLSNSSGGEGPVPWTCWVQLCQCGSGGGWPPLLQGHTTDPVQLVQQHPGPFWQRCLSSGFRNIPQPWPFSDGRQQLHDDTRQLPQRPPVCPVWSHRPAYFKRP